MTQLFINGQQADIDKNTVITFNYSAGDTDNPTAVKSTYSKTVELLGTENNNRIFNNLYDLKQHALSFHSNKRTPFVLYSGGKQQRGYLKLDSISRGLDGIRYRCTLIGELSDFFYNLAYDDKGNKKTFASLHYYFTDENGNVMGDKEETHPIFSWDKDYIVNSWNELYKYDSTSPTVNPRHVITAAPVYHGYGDDMDCKKMLVFYDSLTDDEKAMIPLPSNYNIYEKADGWVVLENSREMDEFEARDLKSFNQCPAVKCSFLLDSISREVNNGGYKVIWDDEVKNSPYYQDTWVIMPKIDFGENSTQADFPFTGIEVNTPYDGYFEGRFECPTSERVDVSTLDSVKVSMTVNLQLLLDKPYKNLYTSYKWLDGTYYEGGVMNTVVNQKYGYVYGGFAIRLKIKSSSGISYSRTHFITSKVGDSNDTGITYGYYVADSLNRIAQAAYGTTWEDLVVHETNFICNDAYATLENGIEISADIPSGDDVRVEMLIKYVSVSDMDRWTPMATQEQPLKYRQVSYQCTPMLVDENTNGIYSSVPPKLQRTTVTKKTLFSSLCTPYEFLLSFIKLLGLKVIPTGKQIHIMPRNRYYTGEVAVLDGLVDLSKGIEIEPILTQYKWHKYGIETPESFAGSLYKKKTDSPYGQLLVDTGYQFNNDTKDIMEGVVFENAIPYRLNSIYFNNIITPTPLISPTFNVEFFDSGVDVKVCKGLSLSQKINRVYDGVPKLCLFDKDYKQSDFKNILAFFTGMDNSRDYFVSDALQACEDYAGGQCYIFNANENIYDDDLTTVTRKARKGIPCFTKYKADGEGNYTFSLDFKKPEYTFLGDDGKYSESTTIYDRFFKRNVEDLYNPENRKITVSAFLHGEPNDLLRRFYYLDGNYWVMEKLSDYCYTSDIPQKITLVRINSTSNYTDNPLRFMKDVAYEDNTRSKARKPQMNGWVDIPSDEVTVYLYIPSQIKYDMNHGIDYIYDEIPNEPNLIDEIIVPKGTPIEDLELPKPRENGNYEFVRWTQINRKQKKAQYDVRLLAVYKYPDTLPKPQQNQIVYGSTAMADITGAKIVSHTFNDGVGVVTFDALGGVLDSSVNLNSEIDTLKLPDSIKVLSMDCSRVNRYLYLNEGLEEIRWNTGQCPLSYNMYYMELPSTLKVVDRLPLTLTTIELPDSVTQFPSFVKNNKTVVNRLLHIRFGKGVKDLRYKMLSGASYLCSIFIDGDVDVIDTNFTSPNDAIVYSVDIQLPSTVTRIMDDAFYLGNVVTLYYPKTVEDFQKLGYNPQIKDDRQAAYIHCSDGKITISHTGTEITR